MSVKVKGQVVTVHAIYIYIYIYIYIELLSFLTSPLDGNE
jgi:hypothetical protein